MMDGAPDYYELSDDEIDQVLEAAGTSLREFLRLSPDVRQGEWENAWSLSQYNLANEREAPTSASAALENRAAATPPDKKVSGAVPKGNEGNVENKLKPIEKSAAATPPQAPPQPKKVFVLPPLSDLKPAADFKYNIDELVEEWIEKRKESPNSPPLPESLWPELAPSIIAKVKRRIESLSNLVPFLTDESSLNEDEESPDVSVLKEGYRPIPGKAWELIERLDNGDSGFGIVWKARNTRSDRFAVFKFCKRPLHHESIQTLHNELRLLSSLSHPGIVRLLDESLEADIPFLEYEWVDGVDFAKLMKERFKCGVGLPIDEAAAVMLKIVEIVAFAHSQPKSIVHRDLKPQNILVANHDSLALLEALGAAPDFRLAQFKVMDFGIAAHSARGRSTQSLGRSLGPMFDGFGTQHYASPQQREGEEACESDDVYALGVIWYQLLTGQLGKGAPSGGAWRDVMTDLGSSVQQIKVLESCLEPERKNRISNAVELAKRIKEAFPDATNVPSFSDAFRKMIQGKKSLDLSHLTSLSVVVAATLKWWNGEELHLNGLKTISVDAAGALAKCETKGLVLSGLKTLSVEVAEALGMRPKRQWLALDGLETISVEIAEALVKRNGGWVQLDGLKTLSVDVVEALAKYECPLPTLNGLETISVEVAEALANCESLFLWLNGLKTLSVDVAEALVKGKSPFLWLNGLKTLSVDVAEALGMSREYLSLDGLETLSVDDARALAKCERGLLSLNGLKTLPVEVAEVLGMSRKSLELNGLETLSVNDARAFAKREGGLLRLNGLKTLSVEVAEALATPRKQLELNGLETLSVDAARALTKHETGDLELTGLKSLSVDVAEVLAKWKGRSLILGSGGKFSVDAKKALSQFNGQLSFR